MDDRRITDCFYFIRGGCSKGDACPFRHPTFSVSEVPPVCIGWNKFQCTNISCRFQHPSGLTTALPASIRVAKKSIDGSTDLSDKRVRDQQVCKYFMSGRCTRSDCAFLHDLPSVVISRHSSTSASHNIAGNEGNGSAENGALGDSVVASVKRQRKEEADNILLKFSVSQTGTAAAKDVKLSAKLLKSGVVLPKNRSISSSSSIQEGIEDPQSQSNGISATVQETLPTVAEEEATEDKSVNQNQGQEDDIGLEIHDDTGFVSLE